MNLVVLWALNMAPDPQTTTNHKESMSQRLKYKLYMPDNLWTTYYFHDVLFKMFWFGARIIYSRGCLVRLDWGRAVSKCWVSGSNLCQHKMGYISDMLLARRNIPWLGHDHKGPGRMESGPRSSPSAPMEPPKAPAKGVGLGWDESEPHSSLIGP